MVKPHQSKSESDFTREIAQNGYRTQLPTTSQAKSLSLWFGLTITQPFIRDMYTVQDG